MKQLRPTILLLLSTFFFAHNVYCQDIEIPATKKQNLEARYTFDFYRSDSFQEKLAAIDYLFEIEKYDVLKKGLKRIPDDRIHSAIIRKLGLVKNKGYLDLFVRYLDYKLTPFSDTRVAAVEALENFQDNFVVPYFLEATENDPHWEVKARAAVAIAKLGNEEDMNRVISMLVEPGSDEGEYQIVLALSSMDAPLSSVALYNKWDSKQQRVVTAITYIMGLRNYEESFEVMVEKLQAKNNEERQAAFFAISLFPGNDPRVTSIMRQALFDKDLAVRLRAVFYLALKGDTESILILQQIAEDIKEPSSMRGVIYQSLKQIGVIGKIVSIKQRQMLVSVGSNLGLKKDMLAQVIRLEPFLDVGSWPIYSLNSTNTALRGPKEVMAAINEDRDNYQVIFLFPEGDYLYNIYRELDLPLWVKEHARKKKYEFTH